MIKENFSLHKNIEQQFTERQKIELLGSDLELVDVCPDNVKTQTPLIFGLGWGRGS